MADLAVASSSLGFANGNLTSKVLTGPTNVSVGDLLYAFGGLDNDGQLTTYRDGYVAPSGWTLVSQTANALGGWGKLWRKVAVSADVSTTTGKSYTWAWKTGASCEMFFVRIPAGDWDSSLSDPEILAWDSVSGTSNSSYSTPNLGTLPKDKMLLLSGWWSSGSPTVFDALPGVELYDDNQSTWEHGGLSWDFLATKDASTARSATQRRNNSLYGRPWLTLSLAVYPAPPAAPSNPDLPGRFLIGA